MSQKNKDYDAGQMLGMLIMLQSIEDNGVPDQGAIDKIKIMCSEHLETYLDKPAEDVLMMVEDAVKEISL